MCSYGQISFAFGFMYLSVYAFYVCFVIYGRHWVDDWIPISWKGVGVVIIVIAAANIVAAAAG